MNSAVSSTAAADESGAWWPMDTEADRPFGSPWCSEVRANQPHQMHESIHLSEELLATGLLLGEVVCRETDLIAAHHLSSEMR